ncbi:MAG: glycosyltransferase family 4 protein [Paludibacteraceae bacterium]|nr:glycosyltransferase family 4 protein [Paludibacteraceae bacterium]
MKHRIAFVGNSALTMINFRLGVMKSLTKHYEVVMIAPPDCELTLLEGTEIRFIPIDVDCKGQNPINDIRLLAQLKRIYAEEQLDFVFHYTIKPIIYGSIAASKLGIKHIDVITGLGYTFIKRNWLFFLSCQLHKYALRNTNAVWFLNQDDCDNFVKWHLVQSEKTHVIHGEGVDTDHFVATREPDKPFVFLHCGRMLRSKGVELYIKAAARLKKDYPQVRWQLLGPLDALNPDAIRPTQMETWVRNGIVEYLGVTNDVRPFLECCSCMVLPSYYMEGVPRSLMEAAAMERPLIATDSVGCKDVVLDGVNGLLCEKRSLDSLVDAMRKILELPEDKLRCMGKKGRELMLRKFDEKIIFNEYLKILQKYLK